VQKILGLGKPLIAMINGYALAAGCLLALTCDLNVASEKAKFGWPEINIGLLGGMQLMVPLVGKVRAADICFTGRTITAQEAFSLGLVNRLASPERLKEETLTLAQDIAKKSPVALKFAKKALRVALEDGPRIATMQTLELNSLCFSSQDQKEGMKAFLEKREPSYIGM
jgi:enoyl-CoA hydratase/carnithine racemase